MFTLSPKTLTLRYQAITAENFSDLYSKMLLVKVKETKVDYFSPVAQIEQTGK